ncbi:glycosyl hydrolase family 18 protein [Thermoflavifilum thermophilum]|uniref:Spore germination protein YaaH n=1 Tax=Thermoflavifilum thermophilum TaxID=1393122 RepID=A0A1I7NC01_9BACT|nr:glycosyl hydrolase family 18 protein [Thermoflavifilum thermophilum]SFV32208.1 Spore germination protein YaaH [Thermoflavifilum thermophilum]
MLCHASSAQTFQGERLFYLVNSLESKQAFFQHADQISVVCPDVYQIDSLGVIYGEMDMRILNMARQKHIRVIPLFASFDQHAIHELLNRPESRLEAIRLMLQYAEQFGFAGWQFDLENVSLADREAYTSFYQQTADSLHAHNLSISCAIVKAEQSTPMNAHPSYERYMYENWSGAFDLPAIAAISDFVSIMTYDQHTALTPPGPVAGYPWMERIIQYVLSLGIPAEKFSLGVPLYSDYWYPVGDPVHGSRSTRDEISYAAVQDLVQRFQLHPQWLEDQKESMAYWENGGVFDWLFVEDARAFEARWELARKYRLRGISAWVLGAEDPAIWKFLSHQQHP